MSNHHQQFVQLFNDSSPSGIASTPIDLYNLKHLVLHGIPDQPSHIRPFVWDLLLAVNSPDPSNSWSQAIDQRRHDYHELMSYFVQQLHPSVRLSFFHTRSFREEEQKNCTSSGVMISNPVQLQVSDSSSIAGSIDQTLRWIQADVNRTQPDLQFFSTPFRLPPDSLSATKLNLFICHLNQAHLSPNSHGNSNTHHPRPSSSSSSSPSPSFSSASSSCYYSTSSKSKAHSSASSSTTARTKSPPPPSSSTHLSASLNSPHPPQAPPIHSINTLLEASSPLTPRLSLQAPSPINSPGESIDSTVPFTYRDVLSRLLAVWSTLNPGIGYVQGMNEIAAVMVYVYSQSYHLPHHGPINPSRQVLDAELEHENMEADAFWAFSALVSNLRELFVNSLDGTPTKVESGFGNIFHQYAHQMDWLDPKLSHHLRGLGVEGKFYVLSWLCCLFTRCFQLPDLLRLWDSLFALSLDTHQASIRTNTAPTSVDSDNGLMNMLIDVCCALTIKLGPTLREQDTFDRIMSILQTVRTQNLSVEDVIEQVLIVRQRRFAAGLDQQSHRVALPLPSDVPILHRDLGARNRETSDITSDYSTSDILEPSSSPGLSRVKALPVDATQNTPAPPNLADIQKTNSNETLGAGIFQKLKHTTEGWRDSDVAAELSKKATNWSIMASSWSTNALISKLTNSNETATVVLDPSPIPSHSPTNRRFMNMYDPNLQAAQFSPTTSSPRVSSQRWSKTSQTSNFSFDSPFQPPVSSCSGSLSGSPSTLGSPINPTHQLTGIGHGPRRLLLSSRARTNVTTTPENSGKVHDLVSASIKRLSGFKLGMNFAQTNDQLDNNRNHLNNTPVNGTAPNVRLSYDLPVGLHLSFLPSTTQESTTVNIFSRSRARSVLSSPIRDRYEGDLSSKPERVSLPNSIHGRQSDADLVRRPANPKPEDVRPIQSIRRRLMHNDNGISKDNTASDLSDRVSRDLFDDVVDEYVSFYDT